MRRPIQRFGVLAVVATCFANTACGGDGYPSTPAGGSTGSTGATSTGAVATGGSSPNGAGRTSTGGASASADFPTVTGGTTSLGGSPGSGGKLLGAGGGSSGIQTGGSGGTPPAGVGGVGALNSGASSGTSSTGGAVSDGGTPSGGRGGAASQSGGAGGAMTSGGAGGAPAVSFAQIEVIVGNNCAGCHVTQRPIFTTTGTALFNTLTSTVVKQCGSHKLVAPGNAASSALIELVTNKCNGFRMPTSCSSDPCLVADELAAVTTWISAGAKGP